MAAAGQVGHDVVVADARAIGDDEQVASLEALLQVGEHPAGERRLARIARQRLVAQRDAACTAGVQAEIELLLVDAAVAITGPHQIAFVIRPAEGDIG
jgi:hypothetical protein